MRNRHDTQEEQQEIDALRTRLNSLVADVQPRPDALPRILSAVRRRREPRRRLISAAGIGVAATAVLLVVLLAFPHSPPESTPASVSPNSYVAESEPGVIASFDVASGARLSELARVPGRLTSPLATDGPRVYAAVSGEWGPRILEVLSSGARSVITSASEPVTVLAAGAGRIAYVDRDTVIVKGQNHSWRFAVPPGRNVTDLALGPDGHVAVLTHGESSRQEALHLVHSGETSMTSRPPLETVGGCDSLAVAWVRAEVALLRSERCDSAAVLRVARVSSGTGRPIGAGPVFSVGVEPERHRVQLSTDRLGRFLVSGVGTRQWLIDNGYVQPIPPACSPGGTCAVAPGAFWS